MSSVRKSPRTTLSLAVALCCAPLAVPAYAAEAPPGPSASGQERAGGERADAGGDRADTAGRDRADAAEAAKDAAEADKDALEAARDGGAGDADRAARSTAREARKTERDRRGETRRLKDVQILAFNDFHGNLEPPTGSGGRVVVGHTVDAAGKVSDATVDAGGAAYLATHLQRMRAGQKISFTVEAGDLIGASPLISAAFHDEPTVEAARLMGVQAGVVGNHEFDEGYAELMRIVRGGCLDDGAGKDNQDSCAAHRYAGTGFPMLAANVYRKGTTTPILPAHTVLSAGGVRIGVVGVVLKDTANIVTQAGIKDLEFGDEVAAIDRSAATLRAQGVNAVVALVHQGGGGVKRPWTAPDGKSYPASTTYDARCAPGGTDLLDGSPILPIVRRADAAVDAFLTAHSHQAYQCEVPDPQGRLRPVTQAASFGRLVTDLHLSYDPKTRDVVRDCTWTRQQIVTRDVPADPAVAALIARYGDLVKPIASRVLGRITADVTKAPNPAGESQLGDLIADAQLSDPTVASGGAPVVAFMNPGGIRADLGYAPTGGEAPGAVTYQKAFAVQPFNNYLVSMDMTGQQIYDLLAQQFTGTNAASPRVLQVSRGFAYTWTGAGQVVPGSVTINGTPVDKSATYRVVANSFLSDGGDGFAAFAQARNKVFGGLDIDAFAAYLEKNSPYTPGPLTRITKG